jgi:D-methionine transport system substrate-binding protein
MFRGQRAWLVSIGFLPLGDDGCRILAENGNVASRGATNIFTSAWKGRNRFVALSNGWLKWKMFGATGSLSTVVRFLESFMRMLTMIAATLVMLAGTASAETIRVGVTAGPHAEILDVVKKVAAERGLDIKVVEFTDYVIPNQALALGDLDANSFQHEPYLKNQISKTGWKIVKVANSVASPQGVYSLNYKKLSDLPEGARVAIANDPSNGARGLMILALHGVIKLKDPDNVTSTIADITENPKKLRFVELDAAQLPRALQDVDVVSINNNYAVQAGLNPAVDAIAREAVDGPWVNIIAVREQDKDKPWVKQFVDAYHSESVKEFLEKRFKGTYSAAW